MSFSGKPDERLDGVWVSDRERTLANIGASDVPEERLRFLRENLGQLRYCFRGDKTAAFFPGTLKQDIELDTYWATSATPTSVAVKTGRGVTRTLYMGSDCFRHAVPGWGYEEYFCRRLGMENPCG